MGQKRGSPVAAGSWYPGLRVGRCDCVSFPEKSGFFLRACVSVCVKEGLCGLWGVCL